PLSPFERQREEVSCDRGKSTDLEQYWSCNEHRQGDKSMPEIREITSGLEFPEGPVAMNDGSVLVVEIKRGTLTRVRPDGSKEVVAETGGGPNGAAIGPDGMVYICNNGGIKWAEDGGPAEGLPAGY